MTDIELIEKFPKCKIIKSEEVSDIVKSIFSEIDTCDKIYQIVSTRIFQKFIDCEVFGNSTTRILKFKDFFANRGTFEQDGISMKEWIRLVSEAYIERFGQWRTKEEACQLVADIFCHCFFDCDLKGEIKRLEIGNNREIFNQLLKTNNKRKIKDEVIIEKVRKSIYDYYVILYDNNKEEEWTYDPLRCDGFPLPPLYTILKDANVPENDILFISPYKLVISIVDKENSIKISNVSRKIYI